MANNHPGVIPIDQNRRNISAGVSSADGTTVLPLEIDPSSGGLIVSGSVTLGGTSGNVPVVINGGGDTQYTNGATSVSQTGTLALGVNGSTLNALKVDGNNWLYTNLQAVRGSTISTAASGVMSVGLDDGSGNAISSNSTTTSGKRGIDTNILSILGTAPTTAGFIDIKGADGNLFVRQTTAANLNATVVGTGTFATQATLAAETTKVIGTVNQGTSPWVVSGSISTTGTTDNSTFTAGTSTGTPTMGFYHSTIDTVTDGDTAVVAIDSKRNQFHVIRDAAGNARGANVNASNQLSVSVDNTPTITANAGTNLNTSLLALESGGNLAAIKTDTDKIPSQGQALAAASMPVVLPAAQITTLTPPSNTGYALDSSLSTIDTDLKSNITLHAGTNVIGHVIADTGSTTAVTGTVTISGAVTEATLDAALIAQEATTSGIKGITAFGAVTTNAPSYTTAKSDALSLDTSGLLRVSLKDTPANTNKLLVTADAITIAAAQTIAVTNAGTFAVQATLAAETTKVIGVTRTADGAGNLLTSTGNALDINIKTGSIGNTSFIATQATAASLNATVVQGTAAAITGGWPTIAGEIADTTGTFTNGTQTTSITAASLAGYQAATISINGTYGTATAVFEGSDDGGTTWYSLQASRTDSATIETGYTSLTNVTRMWTVEITGLDSFRVRSTAVASGTANIRISISASPTADASVISIGSALPAGSAVLGHIITDSSSVTNATLSAETTKVIGTINVAASQTIAVTNAGTFAAQATLAAETTKVIGVVRTSDGAGNLLTSNSTTYTAKFGLDANLLGTLGTAFSTAGKVDVKGADGDVFVRQATATNLKAQVVAGDATGSAVPANAYYGAAQGKTALPTAGSDGNLTGVMSDKFGRQVVLPATIRDLTGTQTTTISASTAETTIVTQAASIFNDLLMLVISNTSTATTTRIDFRDTTGGSVLFSLFSPAADTRGFSLGGVVIPQTSVNTNWTAQCGTSTTDIRIYAVFAKNK